MNDEDARLAHIARLDAELAEHKKLAPVRALRGIGDQADKDPGSIDWAEAVETLEAALAIARERANR